LLNVFIALVLLTIITVVTSQLDLGPMNVPLALAIAGGKATLVVMFFMALKYDNRVNLAILSVGVLTVFIFIAFTLFDTAFRGDIGNVGEVPISDMQEEEAELKAREPDPEALRVAPADFE
jgi:cytochrome c oxidase subunit 4